MRFLCGSCASCLLSDYYCFIGTGVAQLA